MPSLLTGSALMTALDAPVVLPPALVEDFFYEQSVFMLTGKPGEGKSVIAMQTALCLSVPTPLFGSLVIPRPQTVYYLQLECSQALFLHRIQQQRKVILLNSANLAIDTDKFFNVLSTSCVDQKLRQIEATFPHTAVVIIDPLYKLSPIGLSKEEAAIALIRFSDRLLTTLGCSLFLVHHPHREKLDIRGKVMVEDDAYYGHSFIKNHVDTSYWFEQTSPNGSTSQIIRKKLREENALPLINLAYHPESYTVSMITSPVNGNQPKGEAVKVFLQTCAQAGTTTDFYEIKQHIGISDQFLRDLQAKYVKDGWLQLVTTPGKRTIWVPKLMEGTG